MEPTPDDPTPSGTSKVSRWHRVRRRVLGGVLQVRRRLAIADGTDRAGTTERITEGIRIAGESPWMLVCSCLLASIGLDINSTAVIIGAMLISPLMSPILGIGLSVGIADRQLLVVSARELTIATVISLLTSALYFRLSPLGEPTSELIARTTPTLLDVGVAFFGGVAGIVAGSRKKPSLALPGVAIATALMPPICTAGFGLATGRPAFLFGALYLFLLNTLFISLATFAMVRVLKFPLHSFATPEKRRKQLQQIGAVATIAMVPSLWFLYTTVQRQRESQSIERFVSTAIGSRGHDVLRWDAKAEGDSMAVKVFIGGEPLDSVEIDSILAERASYGLSRLRVQPVQADVSSGDLSRLASDLQSGFLEMMTTAQSARDSAATVAQLRDRKSKALHPAADSTLVAAVTTDLRTAFPEIREVVLLRGLALLSVDKATSAIPSVLQLRLQPRVPSATRRELLLRSQRLVSARLQPDSVRVELK